MRIAIVTPGFSSSDDDWCIPVLQDLARGLNERHDVQLYATCYPHVSNEYSVKDVQVKSFGDGVRGRIGWCLRQLRVLRALTRDHQEKPFDVVHGFWADGGGVVAGLFRRRHAVPGFVSVMGGELISEPDVGYGKFRRPIAGRLARFGASRATQVIVSSCYHARRVTQQMPALKPVVLPFGVDCDRFGASGKRIKLEGETPILCVGSLVPVKGHEVLLGAIAAARVEERHIHLHIVGSGALEASLRQTVQRHEMDSYVTYHGDVDHGKLPGYYRGASFCVLSSWFENNAMVVLEAAACGRVTIGSAVGDMLTICPDDLLSTPGDGSSLATNIIRLAKEPDRSRILGEHAAEVIANQYTGQRMVSAHENAYASKALAPRR